MKFSIYTAGLLLLLGTATSVLAQEDKGHSEQGGHAQQQQHEQKQQDAQPQQAQHAKPVQQGQQHAQPAKPAQKQQRAGQVKPAQPQGPAQQAKPVQRQQPKGTAQRTQQSQVNRGNHGVGNHGRISEDHYRASFGSTHSFHVNQGEFRNHRFQYGGYSFGFVNPWPVGWLYTDNVYVDYVDGGYYMFDRSHPGIRFSINIL